MTRNKIDFGQLDWNATNIIQTTAVLDFPNIGGNAEDSLTTPVVGAVIGNYVQVISKEGTSLTAGIVYSAYVSAPGIVTVTAVNATGGAFNPPSQTFLLIVFQF